jgi:pyruvate dehydrogenase E1 component beta subunit
VLSFEHKGMCPMKGEVPTSDDYLVPLARRRGADAPTVVATDLMVPRALEAAEKFAAEGPRLEVIDPRTLVPLDMDTVVASVERSSRALVVHVAVRTAGAGIAARIQEAAFFGRDAPVWRFGALDIAVPRTPILSSWRSQAPPRSRRPRGAAGVVDDLSV